MLKKVYQTATRLYRIASANLLSSVGVGRAFLQSRRLVLEPLEDRTLLAVGPLLINELLAINDDDLVDVDGDSSDWLEVYNPTDATVALNGWYLTDDEAEPTKWQFPAVDVPPDGYRVVIASGKNLTDPAGELHTNFRLSGNGEYLALVMPDGLTVSHAFTPSYPEQLVDVSYGLTDAAHPDECQYFITPTPGMPNTDGALGLVADTRFNVDRGFYTDPFQVQIATETPDAEIRYTTDGTAPTATTGSVYRGPIDVDTTTTLRAAAFKPGYLATNVDTHTYFFLEDVIRQDGTGWPDNWGHHGADYAMDPDVVDDPDYADSLVDDLLSLPSVSLAMDPDDLFGGGGQGIYLAGTGSERAMSIEWIHPDGREFQQNASVQIQGGTSTNRWKVDKLSMRVKFKEPYGPTKLDYPLFEETPVEQFDTLVLDAMMNLSWLHPDGTQRRMGQYVRDQYVCDLQNALSGYAPHGNYVHLYLDGLYWGLYWMHERPDETFAASYLGGEKEDYDVLKHTSSTIVNGTNDDYLAMLSLSAGDLTDPAQYALLGANLDIPNLIDYMITNFYVGNTDWAHHNWYASRNQVDPDGKWRFHTWDAEHVLKGLNDNVTGKNNGGSPTVIHQRLKTNEEYATAFGDRVHELFFHDGLMTPTSAATAYQARLGEIDRGIVGESARWGDNRRSTDPYTRNDEWVTERDRLLDNYFPNRTDIVLEQIRSRSLYPYIDAPQFSQQGGRIEPGFELGVSNSYSSGTVYYTLDGSDPRLTGGRVRSDALELTGSPTPHPIVLDDSVTLSARVFDGVNWSALEQEAFFVLAPAAADNLAVTEVHYHPVDPTADELSIDPTFLDDDFEFLELKNVGIETIDLSGVRFVEGLMFDFDHALVTTLEPGQFVVIASNRTAFETRYGSIASFAGEYTGRLDNGGESVALIDRFDDLIVRFEYNDAGAWPGRSDGKGSSLDVIDPAGDYTTDDNWRSSTEYSGSPGVSGAGPVTDIIINEVLSHTDPPMYDTIELLNTTTLPIDASGWYLSDSSGDYRKYRIPDGTIIPSGGYLVVDETDFNTSGGIDPSDFALNAAHGDDVWLLATDIEGNLSRFVDHVEIDATASGESFGRRSDDPGSLYPTVSPSLGEPNAPWRVGPVVISEVHYYPSDAPNASDLEFVEIFNPSTDAVDLTEWRLRGGIDFDFTPDSQLTPATAMVVVSFDPFDPLDADKLDAFRSAYGIDASVPLVGPFSGSLSNGGERVQLQRPDEPPTEEPDFFPRLLEDELRYDEAYPWPAEAEGKGQSLHRVSPPFWGHDAGSWASEDPTPGSYRTSFSLDIDGNGAADPLTDGLLILRDLFGFSGQTLTTGVLAPNATRTDPVEIANVIGRLETSVLDADANGVADPLSDGILILRYLFGFSGNTLTTGVISPDAHRTEAADVASHLNTCRPFDSNPGVAPSPAPSLAPASSSLSLGVATTPLITEFLADNETGLVDVDGDFSDWIEIHNPTGSDIDLFDWHLTDDADNLTRWTFPERVLPADGYLIVFASGKNRTDPVGELHTNFGLSKSGEYLALVSPDGTTIAAEYAPEYPPQLTQMSYGLNAAFEDELPIDPANCEYFAFPTPGEVNLPPTAKIPSFSVAGGTFVTSFDLTLSTSSPDGVIRYTLDGSEPTSSSTLFSSPIPIGTTTMVRAMAMEPGLPASPVVAEYFVSLDASVTDFDSNLPLIVLDTFGSSIGASVYTTATATLVDTDTSGRASLIDAADFSGRAGLKIRGSSSSNFPKKQYAFEIRGEDDEDLSAGLLGMPDESDWVLYAPYSDKTLMRNHLAYAWSNQIGQYATRTEFVEVFLNTNGGPITESDYVGVYVLIEKIKRDENRVDIEKLEPTDTQEPEITGGYMVKKDRLDPGDTGFTTNSGQRLAFVEPKEEEITPEQSGWLTGYFNEFEAALYGPDFADPDVGYAKYIDVDSFIDHHLLVETTKNIDGYRLSTFFYKDRGEKITAGPIWDYNLSLGNANYLSGWKPEGWYYPLIRSAQYPWWGRLFQDPDFQQRYIDRWTELRRGPFQTDLLLAEIDDVADLLEESQGRNFDRWPILGNYVWPNRFIGSTYAEEIDFMKSWLTDRLSWIDGQYLTAPTFNQDGGLVAADFELDMTAPVGMIYYTLDGSDPRLPGSGISPIASLYTTPFAFDRNTFVRARAFDGSSWSGLTEATFARVSPLPLRLTELMYHPITPPEGSPYTSGDFEFVELLNTSTQPINLVNARFDVGIDFTFPSLDVAPGEYVVVVSNSTAFATRYDTTGLTLAGEFSGRLDDRGETVRLVDATDLVIELFTYNDGGSWPGRADGKGSSLEPIDMIGDPNDPDHWLPSTEYEGSPGRAGLGPTVDIVINEVLTHTDPPDVDAFELFNTTDHPIDLGGWCVSDSSNDYRKYQIADNTILPAGAYRVFDESHFNASGGVAPNDFAFSAAHGDDVWILATDAEGNLTRFVDHVEFGAAANAESFGRFPDSSSEVYPTLEPTLGEENTGFRIGPVVISEVHYNPSDAPDASDLEFIEIFNPTSSTTVLTEWRLRGGIDFDFLPGTQLSAGTALVVVSFDPTDPMNNDKLTGFRSAYGIDTSVRLVGPYSGRLDNGGERVQLQNPDEPPIEEPDFLPRLLGDELRYDDAAPWPTEADGGGGSLHRVSPVYWAHDAVSWTSEVPTPGTYRTSVSLDIDGNGVADPLTDGLLILRHLFGFSDQTLTTGVVAPDATRTDPIEIADYLNRATPSILDVDANGVADPLTDGILALRYLFGFSGSPMINRVIALDAHRRLPDDLVSFLDRCLPFDAVSTAQQTVARQMAAPEPVPIMCEFLADNRTTLADEDGDFSDFIEIYNPGTEPFDLVGWHLTDDAADLTKWTFPPRTLNGGDHLIVFASGKDRIGIGTDSELHTNFSLDADGEYLALVAPDRVTLSTEFAPTFPKQRTDIAYGSGWETTGTLITQGDPAGVFIPADDSLALEWTGAAANEPFDDSVAAGWIQGTLGVGFDTEATPSTQTEATGYSTVSRPTLDGAIGSIFVLESVPFTQPGQLLEWTMFSSVGRSITPMILRVDDTPEYTITGIGQTRISDASGEQQFAFDLLSGSDEVGPGYFFAWKDGGNGTDNAGVAPFTNSTNQSVRWFQQHTTFALDENLGSGESRSRTYSLKASARLTQPAQPLGYWNFDEDANDDSGNSHHGVIHGAVLDDEVPPHLGSGRSLRFDGTDDFVSVLLDVSETSYTASMWFKADASGRGLYAVVNGDQGASGHDRHIYLNGGNLATRVWNNQTIVTSGKNYVDGAWHHVAHVFGATIGGQKIYVDGQLVASGTKASSDFNWQQRINIGFSNDAAADFFQGLIDDVAVWDSVLTEEQIQALSQGASPVALAGYLPSIEMDISAGMLGVNTSAFVRIPFEVDVPLDFNSLLLKMKYDDGFVAWINGHEVLRRNAPMTLTFDAAATLDRAKVDAIRFETFDLTSAIPLLHDGTNVLAIQGLNDTLDGTDFLILPELVAANASTERFLSPPTPGEPNVAGVVDFVGDTKFSIDRGFYTDPFDVAITTVTPNAQIYYTLDGTVPSPDNPTAVLYTIPLHIAETTFLRAAAFKADCQPSNVDTHTYLFSAGFADQPVLPTGFSSNWGGYTADYEVDPDVVNTTLPGYGFEDALLSLPAISLTTAPEDMFDTAQGIYANSTQRGSLWERAASIELIQPDGSEGFQIDAGVRIQGNSSRNHAFTLKHSFRLLFKSEFGASKLDFPLFADSDVDRFDQLVLRASSTDSWPAKNGSFVLGVQRWIRDDAQYIHDQWMRDSQVAMGHPSAHGIYVNLFVNGLYWGQYNLSERVTDSFQAENFGGEREEYDVIKDYAELQSGTKDAWNQMISLASAGLASEADYQRIQGNDPDGTPNPDYPDYLDVDALVDYMILHIYAGAEDWHKHNWWAARRRGPESEGFKFFVWDQEITNNSLVRTHTHYRIRFEDPISAPSPSFLYGKLMANDSFRWKFIDRVHEHLFNEGLLTAEANVARWMARATETDHSIVGESARWGDGKRAEPFKREVEWLDQQDWLVNTYFQEIHPIAIQRFRNVGLYPDVEAPAFNQHGGQVPFDFDLTMTALSGTIHYTTDGSDPRLADGSIAPQAQVYDGTPITLSDSGSIQARALDTGEWSALNGAFFFVNDPATSANFALTEINYHPQGPTDEELAIDATFLKDDFEFIELANLGQTTLDLVGVRFIDGIDFDFSTSNITVLDPGQMVVVVSNTTAFTARYGPDVPVAGQYTGSLRNSGESIELLDRFDLPIAAFSYSDSGSWPGRADGPGSSLEIINPSGDDTVSSNWRSSTEYGGSPGVEGIGPVDDIVINEVLTHTDPPQRDSIELLNTTQGPIDLSGWFLSDSSGDYYKFLIPPGTVLEGGDYLVFDEDDFNTSAGIDPKDFALSSSHGDDVWLMATDTDGKLTRFVDHVDFGAAPNGESFGRWPNSTGSLYPSIEPTLGMANAPPRIGPVVISEIHFNPGAMLEADDLEFVEIFNSTKTPVVLTDWRLRAGVDFDFAPDTRLDPLTALVIVPFDPILDTDKAVAFHTAYSIDSSTVLVGPYTGQLSNGGEKVRLERPDEPPLEEPDFIPRLLEDESDYDDKTPWPLTADGGGHSLNRAAALSWGYDAAGWVADDPTPGTYRPSLHLDIDADGRADALTDGILILRHLFGFSNDPLIQRALGTGATRTDPADLADYLDRVAGPVLDVDADGQVDPLTDGIIVLRYLFGFSGEQLTTNVLSPNAHRRDPARIATFLDACHPGGTPQSIPQAAPENTDPRVPTAIEPYELQLVACDFWWAVLGSQEESDEDSEDARVDLTIHVE